MSPRYGDWPSPISAAAVAAGQRALSFPRWAPTGPPAATPAVTLAWSENRPGEGGRQTVVGYTEETGQLRELLPPPWNARTRVHEYGGASWLLAPDASLVFCEFTDQRLYRLPAGGGPPRPLTPEPPTAAGVRYADLTLVGAEVWCVRERHDRGRVTRQLVAVPLLGGGAPRELVGGSDVGGSDFVAFPRVSPQRRQLAWIAWSHPQLPWDGTELRVAPIAADGTVGPPRTLLGSATESVVQPEWAQESELYAVSDRSGWWNLVGVSTTTGAVTQLHRGEEEFATPLWQLGQSSYAVLPDGRLAVVHGRGQRRLGILDPGRHELRDVATAAELTSWGPAIQAQGYRVLAVAGSATRPGTVVVVDLNDPAATVAPIRSAGGWAPSDRWLPVPEERTFTGPGDRPVHAWVYPPTNPDVTPEPGVPPPYVVFVHGGPTSQSTSALDLTKAFFTSRGIGVLDVNYGGSTGYGRAYRERLREQWGIVDVADCVAAARELALAGRADRQRLVIRGGSAGGWTVLSALTTTDVFAAGTSYFGVAELERFAADTHDFESRYLDGLIGALPEHRARYRDRAPLHHVDALTCPVLLLQGAEDEVVPPSQAELFREALTGRGIPHAYLLFPGEQHGFRAAATIVAALEAELSFYGQVLGFAPPGIPRLALDGGSG